MVRLKAAHSRGAKASSTSSPSNQHQRIRGNGNTGRQLMMGGLWARISLLAGKNLLKGFRKAHSYLRNGGLRFHGRRKMADQRDTRR